jgi:hypothetical protein
MRAVVQPILGLQRDLYQLPRGRERFRRYVEVLRNGDDPLVPLSAMNPMAKDRAPAAVDALLAIDAEGVARKACAEAERRVTADGSLRAAVVVADDAQGGWTERWQTELQALMSGPTAARGDWAIALCWSSEPAEARVVRERVLAALYRALHQRRHGAPRTLGDLLVQEGRSRAFAGVVPGPSPPAAAVAPHLSKQDVGACVGVLFGDPAAQALGYPVLGIPADGGLSLALRQAAAVGPVEALLA